MIRDQWYVILESRQVRKNPKRFRRMGEELVLWRDANGKVNCLVDSCCHRGAALSKGKLLKNGRLQCPFHGLEFKGDGKCERIPANGRGAAPPENFRVPDYPTYEEHGWIWIWWGRPESGIPQTRPEYFPDISAKFGSYTVIDSWKAHYSRVIENQLDVAHLPFVHHNTIGRGERTLVDGPGIQWIGDRMLYVYVFNRKDDGSRPKKPSEIPVPPKDRTFRLELIMPNIWENRIAEKLRLAAAFVPVDEENTLLYMKTYMPALRIPLIGKLIGWLFGRINKIIAHQDRRVVETQQPKASALKSREQLIQGDLPIVEYRRKREIMKNAK